MLIINGILTLYNPIYYSPTYDYTFDATEAKWPLGGGVIIFGILLIWSTFRKKNIEFEKKAIDEKSVLMCPKCVKPFYKKDAPALKCPDCQNPLENLSGFYERHPELKDKGTIKDDGVVKSQTREIHIL